MVPMGPGRPVGAGPPGVREETALSGWDRPRIGKATGFARHTGGGDPGAWHNGQSSLCVRPPEVYLGLWPAAS